MNVDLSVYKLNSKTIAVALSGGADSMALLNYMRENSKKFGFSVIALNVEHGIRGNSSLSDTKFVTDYCAKNGILCLTYSVNALAYADERKLSVEQAARALRYQCFYDAIENEKCDVIATAHHRRDNVESILLNLFRGTGLKGLTGITASYADKIIRPFITVDKAEIDAYVADNSIPFVVDETNLSTDYTRNFLRLSVIPKIKEAFPEMEKSVVRLAEIVKVEDEYLDELAQAALTLTETAAEIPVDTPTALINRAIIFALKSLGLKKDWERAHVENVKKLTESQTGGCVSLPKGLLAIREYDKIIITKTPEAATPTAVPFIIGTTIFGEYVLEIAQVPRPTSFKEGLYADLDKIPDGAVIRAKADGDYFTKFGGGTKKLNDYLTDLKIPLRLRDGLPVIASGNDVLCLAGVNVSDKIRIDENTKNIIKITRVKANENQ